jgi:hypothetical protein
MMRVVRFMLGTIIRLKVVILSVLAGAGIAYGLRVRQESHSWGLDAADQDRELPGDDLVATPDHVETRSLVIEALPATVWPLLTKLGYGRAGWYSYSMLDRAWMVMGAAPGDGAAADRSATEIRAVGDVVPTHPDGGLVAKVVEPDRALVLYLDDALLREQVAEQAAEGSKSARKALDQMDEMPTFGLSWAFVLEPEPGGRTRLVERVRLQMDVSGGQKRALPLMGLGLFAFVRQQMLGIKRRVEAGEG